MGDLKGLLNKEGIELNSHPSRETINTDDVPVLHSYTTNKQTITEPTDFAAANNKETGTAVIIDHPDSSDLPVLDGTITIVDQPDNEVMDIDEYIADIEDDHFDILDLSHSKQELEEKIGSITEPEHLQQFEQQQQTTTNYQIEKLRQQLTIKLSQQIDKSIEQLKTQLLASMNDEIDQFFKK